MQIFESISFIVQFSRLFCNPFSIFYSKVKHKIMVFISFIIYWTS